MGPKKNSKNKASAKNRVKSPLTDRSGSPESTVSQLSLDIDLSASAFKVVAFPTDTLGSDAAVSELDSAQTDKNSDDEVFTEDLYFSQASVDSSVKLKPWQWDLETYMRNIIKVVEFSDGHQLSYDNKRLYSAKSASIASIKAIVLPSETSPFNGKRYVLWKSGGYYALTFYPNTFGVQAMLRCAENENFPVRGTKDLPEAKDRQGGQVIVRGGLQKTKPVPMKQLKSLMKKHNGEFFIGNTLDGMFYPVYNIEKFLPDITVESLNYHDSLTLRAAGETSEEQTFDDDYASAATASVDLAEYFLWKEARSKVRLFVSFFPELR